MPSFEESDVENGRVEVDELKYKYFESQVVVEVRLSSVHLWNSNKCEKHTVKNKINIHLNFVINFLNSYK